MFLNRSHLKNIDNQNLMHIYIISNIICKDVKNKDFVKQTLRHRIHA